MKYLSIVSLVTLVFLSACTVKVKMQDNSKGSDGVYFKSKKAKDNATGIIYSLPKTGLRFKVTTEKIEKTRGEFYLYSERYLGLKNVILEDQVEWKIKNIELESFAKPNENETFQLELVGETSIPNISLSPEGIILGVNADITFKEECEKTVEVKAPMSEIIPYTEEMLLANSSAKMASEAARYIYRLRENRTALLSAELDVLPPDGEAYAMSLEKIDALESKFLTLFKGTEERIEITEIIEVIPDSLEARQVLFRFSAFNGIVSADDFSGEPYFLTMQADNYAGAELSEDSASLYFKQPLSVDITVLDGVSEVLSDKVLMAQFGVLCEFPLGSLLKETKVVYYPETGAIKSVAE